MSLILQTPLSPIQLSVGMKEFIDKQHRNRVGSSCIVIGNGHHRHSTADKFGLSSDELKIMYEAIHAIRRKGFMVFVTIEDHQSNELVIRSTIRVIKNLINTYSKRLGMRQSLYVEILEAKPHIHSHLIVVVPDEDGAKLLIEKLHSSKKYKKHVLAKQVYDVEGIKNYLSGEATTQAWYGAGKRFTRVRGSHLLGSGGGDRVRLSRGLERLLKGSELLSKRKKTYAKKLKSIDNEIT